jgi:hypothetical protein
MTARAKVDGCHRSPSCPFLNPSLKRLHKVRISQRGRIECGDCVILNSKYNRTGHDCVHSKEAPCPYESESLDCTAGHMIRELTQNDSERYA